MSTKTKTKTKTYTIPVKPMRRWRLTPEDLTALKLSLMNWKSSHKELERNRKSLLQRMSGDFFVILYAHGRTREEKDLPEVEATNKPDEGSLPRLSSEK